LVDRSAQQSIYPQVDGDRHGFSLPPKPEPSVEPSPTDSKSDTLTLLTGIASTVSYILIVYLAKNAVTAMIVSGLLAAVTMVFAITAYYSNDRMTPYGVIGLSAATYTAVMVLNILVAKLFIQSSFGY
jgi:hypothetical protein